MFVCVCSCEVYVGVRRRQSSERKQSFSIPSDKTTRSNASLLLLRRNAAPVLCNAALTLVLALLLLFFRLLFLRPPPPPHCCVVFVAATQFGDLLNRLCRHFSQDRNTHTDKHTRDTRTHTEIGRERQGRDTLTFKYGSKARSLRVLAPHFLIGLVFLAFQNTNTHTYTLTHSHMYTSTPIQRGTWKQSLNHVCFYLLLLFSLSLIVFRLLKNYIGNHLATFN